MDYFPNKSGFECFRSSLCNLLIEENEIKLAKQVFDRFQDLELVSGFETLGVNLALTPKLVRDLTNNKYQAVLQTAGFNYNVLNQPHEVYPKKLAKKISKNIQKDLERENIILTPTSKIFTKNYLISTETPELNLNHFRVQRFDGKQINDGFIEKTPNNQQITGTLQIYKR